MAPVPPGMVSWSAVSHSSLPLWSMSANLPWLPSVRSACPACHASIALRLSDACRPRVYEWAMPLWAMKPVRSP
jgi:hypothetical protein